MELAARYDVVELDSLRNKVTFEAIAPDTLWWKLEWVDLNILMNYGRAVYNVKIPISYTKKFRFWLDFTVWNQTDTAHLCRGIQ